MKYEVIAVPTFVFIKVVSSYPLSLTVIITWFPKGGKVVDRVNGAHVPELSKKTAAHSQTVVASSSLSDELQPAPPKEVLITGP